MKLRLPVLVWLFAMAVFLASIAWGVTMLPERVATHFGASGQPNGWMNRSTHLAIFTLFGLGFSGFVTALFYVMRFLPASLLNVPRAAYWREPAHYRQACAYLFSHSFWAGALAFLWCAAIQGLIVQANRLVPVHLNAVGINIATGIFLGGTALWIGALLWYFAHPEDR